MYSLRVVDGGNAQHCLLSLGCQTVLGCESPPVTFWVGREERKAREERESIDLYLIITGYEIIEPPYKVSMKAIFETDLGVYRSGQEERGEREFIFTIYNTSSRKGWVQVPKRYLPKILEHLKLR